MRRASGVENPKLDPSGFRLVYILVGQSPVFVLYERLIGSVVGWVGVQDNIVRESGRAVAGTATVLLMLQGSAQIQS